ncbi:hypothetical protein ACN9MZ_22650 [Pseudoduganella sp. S-14]|uniref:hypothetical protein n=1 Tax=Pseudoduganella sp. S-14 TaxID=3404065 RepID=UPI003CEDE116
MLTVLAHLAVLASVGRQGAPGETAPQQASSMLVLTLLSAPASVPAPDGAEAQRPAPASAAPAARLAPAEQPSEPAFTPRYFQQHELTEQPSVASGLARRRWLVLPGAASGNITVRFWINDMGDVIRVHLIHSDANEKEQAAMLAALQQVLFHPAHIGRIAVHSEVQMDLRVVGEVGF